MRQVQARWVGPQVTNPEVGLINPGDTVTVYENEVETNPHLERLEPSKTRLKADPKSATEQE